MITVNKANPTPGEITSSLTGSTGDGAGLHLANNGYIDIANNAATEFSTTDFTIEFVLNQTADNVTDSYIYFSHIGGGSVLKMYNDVSANVIIVRFTDSGGSNTDVTLNYDMSADYGTPTHYVFAFDRSADLTLYKNGNSVASVDISAAASINIGAGNANVSRIADSTNYGVLGTFYRFRAFNTLADAKLLFERADVPQTLTANLLFDLDFAFANPTQSLTIQDRKGNTDGTASSSTLVTQVQPVVQLNSEELRVAGSAPKIGVGLANTVTPAGKLHVHGADGEGYLRLSTDTTGATASDGARIGYNGSDLRIQNFENSKVQFFTNNTTEALTIDSTGSVAITGNTDTSTFFGKTLAISDAGNCGVIFKKTTGTTKDFSVGVKSDGTFNIVDDSTPRLTIGSDGGVGINTAPDANAKLDVNGTIYVRNTSVKGVISNPSSDIFDIANASGGTSNPITFSTQGSERMRIASTGHVAMTSDDSDAQLTLTGTGTNAPAKIDFVPQGTGNARIQVGGSDKVTISSTGLCTFSGGINLGDTTLSNYAEGTWTPAATGGGSIAGTSITYTGNYTRIGNLVTVWFTITAAAQDLVIASYVGLAGLPFTVASSGTGWYSTEDVDAERGGEMKAAGTVLYLGPGGSGSATNSIAGSVTYKV